MTILGITFDYIWLLPLAIILPALAVMGVASGIWYSTPQYELRGKGDEAEWTVGRRVPTRCKVKR